MRLTPTKLSKHLVAILVGTALLTTGPAASAVSKEEIMTLSKLKIGDDEIIAAIDRDKTVFDLAVAEILELKKANVSEKVIKYMLATPKKFGAGTDVAGPGDPTGPAGPSDTPPAETEEERLAREERLRQESQKLIEEKRRAEEAQRKAYAQGVLKRCQELGDGGDYVGAVQAAQQFVEQGGFAADSEEAYYAKFCTANAFVKAGLLQSAASTLVEIVLDGPEKPFFQTAFKQLRSLRKQIDYSPPQLERLADFSGNLGAFSRGFQDEFNYVLGEFFHEGTEWTTAVAFLDAVSPQSPDYAKAQYLKGFMEVQNDLYKSAVGSFQRAITATEENESAPEVRDLAFLALARIAYRIGDYDAAIYYYRKIPAGSYKQATAFYESAWVYFLKGDYPRALGTFHTIDSPAFSSYFYPEMWILEATAYLNTCHFDRTQLSLKRFEEEIMPLLTPLENFLNKTTRPAEFYKAVVASSERKTVYELPPRLISPVLANVEFYNLYRTIKQIEKEIRRLDKDGARLGPYGADLLTRLNKLRGDRIRQIGLTIRLILSDTLKELQKFKTKYIELGIDLEDIKIEEQNRQERERQMGGAKPEAPVAAQSGGTSAIVGSDTWRWPFDNEYWADEIGSYRSFVKDLCAREAAE